jgi:hypothetical protein
LRRVSPKMGENSVKSSPILGESCGKFSQSRRGVPSLNPPPLALPLNRRKVCSKFLRNRRKVCSKFLRNRRKVCSKFLRNRRKVCPKFLRNRRKVCAKFLRNRRKVCPKFLRNRRKLSLIFESRRGVSP